MLIESYPNALASAMEDLGALIVKNIEKQNESSKTIFIPGMIDAKVCLMVKLQLS